MKGNGRQIEAQQSHVLHDERIDLHIIDFAHQLLHGTQFAIVDNGVDGDIDTCVKAMCRLTHAGDVGHRVASRHASTKPRRTHIHRIGAMLNSLKGYRSIAGRSQQFNLPRHGSHQGY